MTRKPVGRATLRRYIISSSIAALAWGSAASAQAPETQTAADPQPAEAAAADAAGENNTAGPGNSPSTQSADTSGVEEIVVTAQFREQNLQETPIAITAVSGAMLEARSQTSIVDVANQAPSVTLKSSSSAFGPSLGANIRGIGQFDPSPAVEPGVGIYVDDVYYSTLTGSILDLLDLDRVEILRGPQGTLAGRNSIGGAIKLYSKKPTGDGGGYVSATYGSRDRIELRASADFKLTDSLFGRIAGVGKKQDGYVTRFDFACLNPPGSPLNPAVGGLQPQIAAGSDDCVAGTMGDVDTVALRGQLRFDNGGPVEINLIADYTNDKRTPAPEVLRFSSGAPPWVQLNAPAVPQDGRFFCGPYCQYGSFFNAAGVWTGPVGTGTPVNQVSLQARNDFEGWGVSGQVDWEISDRLQLVSITAYRQWEAFFTYDSDLSPIANSLSSGAPEFWGFSQEVRLNGSIGDNDFIEYTVGGFYMDQKFINQQLLDLRYTPFPLQFEQDDPVTSDTKAVFGQVIFNFTDQFTAVGGLRYTEENKRYEFYRRNYDGTLNPFLNPPGNPIDGQIGTYAGDRIDYRVSLQYEFTPDIMAYGQVSTGFKGGGINPRPFNPAQVRPFDPETLTSYELGLKTDLFDRLARINVAAFFSDYKGIQLTLLQCPQFGGPGPCTLQANAGDGEIKGLELEVSLRPAQGLSIDGALSYTDFKYTRLDPAAGGPTTPTGPQFGDVTPYTPEWKWSIGIQYEIPLGDSGSITPRFDAAYQSDVYSNPQNNPLELLPAYTLANARITWRNADEDLEVSGEVTNLFDEYYFLTAFDLTQNGGGFATAQPGRPREWALTVKKKF